MPWGRIDDKHYRHPKVQELSEEHRKGCLALYWMAISWCNDTLTDGRVPASTVRLLGFDKSEADELVRVGLWEKDGPAYRVHDFLDFNKSKEQVVLERVQRTEAGRLGAAAKWQRRGGSPSTSSSGSPSEMPSGADGTVPGEPTGEVISENDAPYPVSRIPSPFTPEPTRAQSENEDAEGEAVTWLARHGCYLQPSSGYYHHLVTMVEQFGINAVIGMFDRLASAGVRQGDVKGFVFGAKDALNAQFRPDLKALEREERQDEQAEAFANRVKATKVRLHEIGGHQQPDPGCPRCQAA